MLVCYYVCILVGWYDSIYINANLHKKSIWIQKAMRYFSKAIFNNVDLCVVPSESIKNKLLDISNPLSENWRNYLTVEQIRNFSQPSGEIRKPVLDWFPALLLLTKVIEFIFQRTAVSISAMW